MSKRRRNGLILMLSLAAGCVDASVFVQTGVFPANMTGNSVLLALALVRSNIDHAGLSFLALICFAAGVCGTAWFLRFQKPEPKGPGSVWPVLALAGIFLLGAACLPGRLLPDPVVWLVGFAAAAMGMQSVVVLRWGVAGISTTVITGTLTTGLVRFVERWPRPEHSASPTENSPWLPLLSWLLYFGGAFLGGLQSIRHADLILFLPAVLLAVVAWGSGICKERRPPE